MVSQGEQLKSLREALGPLPQRSEGESGGGKPDEASVWAEMAKRNALVQGWCLAKADDWKTRTAWGARKSFKVLDQSLAAQMERAMAPADETMSKSLYF